MESRSVTNAVIDQALKRIVQNDDPLYTQLWNGLTGTQKKALKAVIHSGDDGLYSTVVQQKTGRAASSMQAALRVLQEKGFVREEEVAGSTRLSLRIRFSQFGWNGFKWDNDMNRVSYRGGKDSATHKRLARLFQVVQAGWHARAQCAL